MSSGKELVIRAIGTVKHEVKDGAYVLLQVKYGLIRLLKQKIDLCEQVGEVDLKCPIKAGILDLTKTVELPNEIPPVSLTCHHTFLDSIHRWPYMLTSKQGTYNVFADVFNADDSPITCLTATVIMNRGSALGSILNNFDL